MAYQVKSAIDKTKQATEGDVEGPFLVVPGWLLFHLTNLLTSECSTSNAAVSDIMTTENWSLDLAPLRHGVTLMRVLLVARGKQSLTGRGLRKNRCEKLETVCTNNVEFSVEGANEGG